MTTLTLQIENPFILVHLKAVLKAIKGVKVLSNDKSMADSADWEEVPNSLTLAAMKEAESGHDAGTVSTDSLENFIASLK